MPSAGNSVDVQNLAPSLEAYMEACASVEQFSGAVLLSLNGKLALRQAYGMADLEHRVANSAKTKFRLGSITKPITAMAVYMLVEDGKLSVDAPLKNYVPDCPPHWEAITIQHLLCHRSGLANFTDFPDYAGRQRLPSSPWQTVERFKSQQLLCAPGERSCYNNSGYILLGAIIEVVSGKTYADFLAERIFRPLKMYDTGCDSAEPLLEHRARGYVRSKQSIVNANFIDMSIPFSAGGLYSTIDDLFLLEQAIAAGTSPIPEEVIKAMNNPVLDNYCAGWHLENRQGRLRVGHSGGIDGFCTIMLRYPREKLAIVVLSNVVSWLITPERIAQDLSAIVFNEPYEIPRVRQVITLDSAEYDIYEGIYALVEENTLLKVSREGNKWMAQFADQQAFEIFAESESEFFVLDFEGRIKFCLNTRKEVSHIYLVHEGQATRAYKVG